MPKTVVYLQPHSYYKSNKDRLAKEPHDNVIELKSSEGAGVTQDVSSQDTTTQEKPKTSEEKRQDAEAKLLELIKEQSKLQTGLGRGETTTNRLIPGIINKLTDIKNNLGPPKGAA